ncbi:class I SAM-dependent methyltransferase [Anaeromyxobacter sp. SG66]|uniref:class I SAM-dependent methyltransferase n=1 Tax=Anaeromyxobacter sp. SG66 TaxID=2925410 RepID=UPI001F596A9C|nr:class I SAM-dependent methyltransferase [Anaeromyxobacter sp. SG66]
MSTPNPWTVVQADDYERHMGPEGLDQRAPLAAIFQEAYLAAQPGRLLVLGCGTGNGLDHVDPSVTSRIVGVDVNLQYLGIARQRYFHLGPRLELYCAEAEKFRAAPGSFDLVHVPLLFEYVFPEVLVRRVAEWLADGGGCTAVVELPGGDGPTPPSKPLQLIGRAKRLVPPEELEQLFEHYGMPLRREHTVPLPHGRSFWVGSFGRPLK